MEQGTVSTGIVFQYQSVMSATDSVGYWDVHGLSATDPRQRQWISKQRTMPKDVVMPS